jgi:hypothetical protein
MPSLFEAYGIAENDPVAEEPKREPRGALGVAKDAGISLLKGAIDVPEAAVGLADLVTGGHAGRAAEAAGFRPREAKAMLDEGYSQEQKDAFARVQAAQGFGDTFMAAVQNPSVVAHSVLESLPSMAAGGVVARGGMAIAPGMAPLVGGAIGEGAVQAGQAAESIRQENPDGLLTAKQAGVALASGAIDTGLALLGGKIAKSLGIADVDTMLAGAKANPVAAKGLVRRVLEGAASEGLLEELPQSIQEQVLQNYALGKPLEEGVNQAAVLGMLSGAAMGGGANVVHTPAPPPVTGPLSRAANAVPAAAMGMPDPNAAAQPAAATVNQPSEPAVDPVLERIKTLQGADRTEALAAYNIINRDDSPKGVRQYNSRLLDDLLAKLEPAEPGAAPVESSDPADLLASGMNRDPVQGALAAQRDAATAQQNLDNWMARAPAMPLEKAQELQTAAADRGMAMEVVPHGAGQGFTVVPAAWVTPEMRGQVATALPMDTVPTGVLRADATGTVAPETGAQRIDTSQQKAAIDAEAQRKADLGLTPDVEAVQVGKKRAPKPTAQQGDVLSKKGEPFKNKGAALRAQKAAGGGDVLEVQGGWVVRTEAAAQAVQQELEAADGSAADGTGSVAAGAGGAVGAEPAGGQPAAAAVGRDAGGAGAVASSEGVSVQAQTGESAAAVAEPPPAASAKKQLKNIPKNIPAAPKEQTAGAGARWADAAAAQRETLLLAAGWKTGSTGLEKMKAQAWDKMTQGQRNRITKAAESVPEVITSSNYVPGESGYRIGGDGAAEFNSPAKGAKDDAQKPDRTGGNGEQPPAAAAADSTVRESGHAGGDQAGGAPAPVVAGAAADEGAAAPAAAGGAVAGDAAQNGADGKGAVAPPKSAKTGTAAPDRIDDFGEKLLGARKDYAALMKDAMEKDVAAVPLSQSWPEPDYDKLLAGGADAWSVAFVHAARDEIPTKPQKSYRLKPWVQQVQALRDFAQKLLAGEITAERLRTELAKPEFARLSTAIGGRAELYERIGHDKSLKGISVSRGEYMMFEGKHYNPAKVIWSVEREAKATVFGNWPRMLAMGDTREAAIDSFVAKVKDKPIEAPKKGATFDIWRESGKVHLGKKVGKQYVTLKTFDGRDTKTVIEARAYRDAHLDDLVEALEKYKTTPFERRTENAPRVGDDHRGGARMTPEAFQDAFGFRGVQFGNYVENDRRQQDLNDCYDALMDMAAVIGVPPRALSLDGKLGLAFGARGKGGKNAPSAHYEGGHVVINLTKGGGAGALAHEWFHAVDNYFAKQDANGASYMTMGPKIGKVRPEMRAAFANIMAAIKATKVPARSAALDERKSKPYWSTNLEMAARSYEAYIVAKLQDQNAANDYLANIVSEQFWNAQEALAGHENEKTYPYPTEAEMGGVREAFDAFFRTVETKPGDSGNVVMFKRADGKPIGTDLNARAAAVQQFVDGIKKNWANAPEIIVVPDMQDARVPEFARETDDAQRNQGSEGDVHGFHYQGKVYLVAGTLDGPETTLTTLAHEALGHYGLQGFFGEALKPIKQQIVAMRKKEVLAKAEAYGMPVTPEAVRAELGKGATAADVQKVINMRLMYAAEEVLAEMAQTTPQIGFVRRAIAAIKTWLREHVKGFADLQLSDDEIIRSFILPARGWVVRGEGTGARRVADEPAPAAQFSRGDAGNTLATDRPLRESIMQAMNDTFTAPGKLNWWHKTVGTQYNLAQRSPQFKRVFDSVQDFLNDVSLYASEAADLAPKILPKLETWRDIGKSPIAAADNKAISAPIFEGTLLWARDERGRPVKIDELRAQASTMTAEAKAQRMLRAGAISENVLKMWKGLPLDQYEASVATRYESQMLRPGVVWKDDELRSQFKLTDGQIALYKEFRAAVDRSLTHLAVADMVRFGGKDVAAVRQEALDAGDVDAAALILRDHLMELAKKDADRNDLLLDTAERMIEKADRARDLMDHGYAPLSRFGHYTVDAIDENGDRVYFGMFESPREAALMARKMKGNFPKAAITRGTVSEEEYKLFAGVSPETVELFGELLGLEAQGDDAASKAFQTYIKVAKANRSAMKRLIERKGIAGFSEDVGRVLAGFVYSNARQTSQNLHMGEMTNAAAAVTDPEQGGSKALGELKDQATRLVDYVKNPQEEAQGFRGLLFAQYLGGSVASALVNMLQPVQVTFPYLSQFGGVAKAASRMTAAFADMRKKTTGDAQMDAALKKAEEEGIVAPQEVHQLMAQARGRGVLKSGDGTTAGDMRARASNALSRLSLAWGKVFGAAEQMNRRVTFIAAYRTAVAEGIADPAAFAEKAIAETQFVYNKGNKPQWARGAVGSTLFTFKQYSISYVELLHRMATQGGPEGKKAVLLALGMLFLFGGAGGLPFEEDAEDLVDGVMQRLGYNFSAKLAKKQFFERLLGKELGRFAEHGISGLPGVPIDVSGRLGMGNLIPGTGLLVDKEDHTRDVTEFLGAGGDFATRVAKGANKALQGDLMGAAKDTSPRATANAVKALEMYSTGQYKDDKGRKVIDVDGFDASMKALGFQPTGVAQVQEATGLQQQLIAGTKQAETRLADRWAKAVAENDQDALAKVREDLRAWNEKNADTPIRINRSQIASRVKALREDKASRIERTAPKEIRATVRRALEPV